MKTNLINSDKLKLFFNRFFYYTIILASLVGGFFIGRYFHLLSSPNISPVTGYEMITKSQVNLAIDQSGNLLMINRSTGNIEYYQDSIGIGIFHIYAKNLVQGE